jgi:hypothetical protein
MSKKKLNLREYWDAVGTENMQKIINDVGSSMAYFRMLRYGVKRPGSDMALTIIESARKHTPTYEPDLELLLRGVPRAGSNPVRQLPPSPEFLRAQKRLANKEPAAA